MVPLWKERMPFLNDRTETTGFDRHYVYHVSWAARVLAKIRPAHHIDISSSLYFCGVVSAFIPVSFYDYRLAPLHLSDLESKTGDLLALPFCTGSVPSVSCMHVVEHIGLGRYGDPLDPLGDLKAIAELQRVVATNGTLLFVVPVGKSRVVFNAHRIFAPQQIIERFPEWELVEFALVPDGPPEQGLIRNASLELAAQQEYGCGCFWFQKK